MLVLVLPTSVTTAPSLDVYKRQALYHIHVSVEHPAQLKVALSVPEVGAIYLDSAEFGAEQWNEWVSRCHEADKQCLLVMPHIFRDRAKEYFETHRSRLESAGFDGLVIRAWEELELVREWKISIPLVMDYGIYTMNHRAEDFVREMAPELSICLLYTSFRQENRELYQYLDKTYVKAEVKEPVQGFARVCEGEPLQLTLQYEDPLTGESRMAGGIGAVVQTAVKQPMSKERIEKQLGKTGNTPYYFENLEVETGGSPFVPVQELNELRRSAFEQLTEEILRPYRRELSLIHI